MLYTVVPAQPCRVGECHTSCDACLWWSWQQVQLSCKVAQSTNYIAVFSTMCVYVASHARGQMHVIQHYMSHAWACCDFASCLVGAHAQVHNPQRQHDEALHDLGASDVPVYNKRKTNSGKHQGWQGAHELPGVMIVPMFVQNADGTMFMDWLPFVVVVVLCVVLCAAWE